MTSVIAAMLVVPGALELTGAPGTPDAAAGAVVTSNRRPSTELALAAALVDALNQSDEDAVVGLFDPEATLRLDRYA